MALTQDQNQSALDAIAKFHTIGEAGAAQGTTLPAGINKDDFLALVTALSPAYAPDAYGAALPTFKSAEFITQPDGSVQLQVFPKSDGEKWAGNIVKSANDLKSSNVLQDLGNALKAMEDHAGGDGQGSSFHDVILEKPADLTLDQFKKVTGDLLNVDPEKLQNLTNLEGKDALEIDAGSAQQLQDIAKALGVKGLKPIMPYLPGSGEGGMSDRAVQLRDAFGGANIQLNDVDTITKASGGGSKKVREGIS